MELFERVLKLEAITGSKSATARMLGITPQRLEAYSNATSQRNLWERLPHLLQALPNVRRMWLYFEEGPMLKDPNNQDEDRDVFILQEQVRELTEANRRLAETNQRLSEELLKRQ